MRRIIDMARIAFRSGLMLALSLATAARAEDPRDATLPELTPAQLAAKIRESMARYGDRGTVRVLFTETRDTNFRPTGDPIWVSFRGRARYESDGTRWRTDYDSMIPTSLSTRLTPDRWSSGFDGHRSFDWDVTRHEFRIGVAAPRSLAWTPRGLVWEQGTQILLTLEETASRNGPPTIDRRSVDGFPCYVIRSEVQRDGRRWGSETVISPTRAYLPVSWKWTLDGTVYASSTMQGIREIGPGLWAPDGIERESISVPKGRPARLNSRTRTRVVEYRPDPVPPPASFEQTIPYGVDVVDLPNGSSFQNDPWWPDIAPMLHEKYGWPKPNLSWLKFLGSGSEKPIDGKPAPPLHIKEWINTKPMDLASLRGKVTLLEFGTVLDSHYAPRYATALKELYAAYHPAGLEILSIHVPKADVAGIRRFASDYRIPYPIVLDDDRSDPTGDTAKAFAIRGRICAFLIDHEGKIRSVGEPVPDGGHVVETIVTALQKAGARDVKPISVETPRLPDAAYQDAQALFQAKAKASLDAKPQGKITGRILDGAGRPIRGANLQVTLQFSFLIFAEPGGYFGVSFQRPAGPFAAEPDADGRFEVPGLCKGGYLVKVTAPGKAWVERKVYLGADLAPASTEIELKQGDTIAGILRDRAGKPIANAMVTPNGRQHFVGDELSHTSFPHIPSATTDDEGRFRFANLQEGRYLLKVEAPNFKVLESDAIPAGTQDVTLTLKQ